ncbi:cytochrome P450 [Streptomyces sp. G-G2]|uniref:cytochrome P450 n=1 Tax=Streptomyces sp. G-G2 TaxID=3046201 RepID=UPI0024B94373|nr:cytochrome P450 [Streptomyces sp. G-G2]MDJ0383057.1 cytochrome P450 [Streptomyces sp. G-G2]
MPAVPGPRTPAHVVRTVRAFQRSLPEGLEHLKDEYGEVSAFGLGPTRTYFLFGPQANALVMRNPDNFRFAGAYDMLRPIAGETALVVTDGPPHARRKRKALPSFQRPGVEQAGRLILAAVDRAIDSWRPGQRLDIHAELREAVRGAMLRLFCGERLAAQAPYLIGKLDQIHELMDNPLPQQMVAWSLPTRARRRALDGIAAVEQRIYAELTRRRLGGEAGTRGGEDLISVMLADDGAAMSDQEIRDMVVSALIPGYDPVGSGIGWAVYNSLAHPGVWQRMRAEAEQVLDGAPATPADVRGLRYTGRVVQESLRLHPPVVMSPRRCVKAFRYGGHLIPAGSTVAVSEYITHRLPSVWDAPDAFRPERWDTGQEGYEAPSPFEYLPYGYGARRCIGAGIAGAVLPAVLSRLAQRTELDLLTLRPQYGGIPALIPRGGLRVQVVAKPPVRATARRVHEDLALARDVLVEETR